MAHFCTPDVLSIMNIHIFTKEIFSINSLFIIQEEDGRGWTLCIFLNAFFRDNEEFPGCFCFSMLKEIPP